MKVYFTASVVGKRQYLPQYLRIINHLLTKNHEVMSDHIIKTSESEIRIEKKEDRIKFHENLENWIKSSDCIIAETSFPSISVGYEISIAAHLNKPILILYADGNPPSLLAHHKDEKLICEKYTAETYKEIIDDFLNYARDTSDSRFTFFITSRIASYLEDISVKKKIPKSVYLRRLIEKDMNASR